MNTIKKQGFYDLIVDNYADDSHLVARRFQDGTCSIRIKKGNNIVHNDTDRSYINAFINRASESLSNEGKQFKISFDYKNHRLHFNIRKGGVVTSSESRRVLKANGSTEISFSRKDEIFYAEGENIMEKFKEMVDCAMGYIQIINYNLINK